MRVRATIVVGIVTAAVGIACTAAPPAFADSPVVESGTATALCVLNPSSLATAVADNQAGVPAATICSTPGLALPEAPPAPSPNAEAASACGNYDYKAGFADPRRGYLHEEIEWNDFTGYLQAGTATAWWANGNTGGHNHYTWTAAYTDDFSRERDAYTKEGEVTTNATGQGVAYSADGDKYQCFFDTKPLSGID